MRTARNTRKRGFTLVETVVTVGIIAALAAIVYPTVVRQFDNADPTRVAEDLNNIRTGIETFGVNVRPHQPGDIEDLSNAITAADLAATGVNFDPTVDVPKWIGPYIGVSVSAAAVANTDVVTTGFGATIVNGFALLDINGATPTNDGGDVIAAPGAAADFIAIHVRGLTGPAFDAVNALIDGPSEVTVAERRSLGRFRCPYPTGVVPAATAACTDAYFLAAPMRH